MVDKYGSQSKKLEQDMQEIRHKLGGVLEEVKQQAEKHAAETKNEISSETRPLYLDVMVMRFSQSQ